jgi:hypothetical protein
MIPYRADDVADPTQDFPLVTVGLIVVNFIVFFYELALGGQGAQLDNFINASRASTRGRFSSRRSRDGWRPPLPTGRVSLQETARRVAGKRVEIPPVLLDIFPVVALRTGQPECTLFEDRVTPIPQRKRQT